MHKSYSKTNIIFYIALGVIIFMLILKKAIAIPITHDEVNTIATSHTSFYDIITYKDPVPNNHIFNTLLIKINQIIFGNSLIAARLHNVLFFIPFYIFTVLLSSLAFRDSWIRAGFTLTVILQPYLLDFFSVTRGYGLSLAFLMVSLYYVVMYERKKSMKLLVLAEISGVLGVYANLTLLNYFIPIQALIFYLNLSTFYTSQRQTFWKTILIQLVSILVLGLLMIFPILKMTSTDQFVYWGSTGFFSDTVVALVSSLKYTATYFNWTKQTNALLVVGIIIITISLGIGIGLYHQHRQKSILYLSVTTLFLVLVYNALQFYILKIPFLNARTSLFFVPISMLPFFASIDVIQIYLKKVGTWMTFLLIVFITHHFIITFQEKNVFEWWFDENTFEVLDDVQKDATASQITTPIMIDCSWLFQPSLSYHGDQCCKSTIQIVPYHKDPNANSDAIYYYATSDEAPSLDSSYHKIKEYGWGSRILFKKNGK